MKRRILPSITFSSVIFKTSGPPESNSDTSTNPSWMLSLRKSSHVIRMYLLRHGQFSTVDLAPYWAYYSFERRIFVSSIVLKYENSLRVWISTVFTTVMEEVSAYRDNCWSINKSTFDTLINSLSSTACKSSWCQHNSCRMFSNV